MACRSDAGFQSKSNNTRREAPIKFSPTPPALALNKNTTENNTDHDYWISKFVHDIFTVQDFVEG